MQMHINEHSNITNRISKSANMKYLTMKEAGKFLKNPLCVKGSYEKAEMKYLEYQVWDKSENKQQ